MAFLTSFRTLRALSFLNSVIFSALLFFSIARGFEAETTVFGWAHGCLWIGLSVLCLIAVRRRTVPFWLAVVVTVLGGVGPFVGTAAFVWETRRRGRGGNRRATEG